MVPIADAHRRIVRGHEMRSRSVSQIATHVAFRHCTPKQEQAEQNNLHGTVCVGSHTPSCGSPRGGASSDPISLSRYIPREFGRAMEQQLAETNRFSLQPRIHSNHRPEYRGTSLRSSIHLSPLRLVSSSGPE